MAHERNGTCSSSSPHFGSEQCEALGQADAAEQELDPPSVRSAQKQGSQAVGE